MILINGLYLPLLLIIIFFFSFFYIRLERKFFQWVKDHWFYQVKVKRKISSLFYLAGISAILFSLLDLRGGEESAKINSEKQKTIILIDNSYSMWAEDVFPNRFEKSIFLARNFIKSAPNHLIAIFLFSDQVKQLTPFTNDSNYLDSKLEGLIEIGPVRGGSNINQALQEVSLILKENKIGGEGNILTISDAESNTDNLELLGVGKVNVAFLAVGSEKGGHLRIRDNGKWTNEFKLFKGERVISKMDINFLKELESRIENFKHWTIRSNELPVNEIMEFFHDKSRMQNSEFLLRQKESYFNYFILIGTLFVIASYLLKMKKIFFYLPIAIVILNVMDECRSSTIEEFNESIFYKMFFVEKQNIKIDDALADAKKNGLNPQEMTKIAHLLLKDQRFEEANILFEESLNNDVEMPNEIMQLFNYGTTNLMLGKLSEGIMVYQTLREKLKFVDDKGPIQDFMRYNVLLSLKKQAEIESNRRNGETQACENGDKGENGQNKINENLNQRPRISESKNGQKGAEKIETSDIVPILSKLLDDDRNAQKIFYDTSGVSENSAQNHKDW